MNAAIRAVVRTAVYNNVKVMGIRRGYDGLLGADIFEMDAKSVSDIVQRGGTILKTARSAEMMTDAGQSRAAQVCQVMGIECVVVLGGDGSLRGGAELAKRGVNVMGIPCTIDLDIGCTEYTIGFDTAVNTGMEAINKIRDTSSSHERVSVIEVMGRDAGHIALWCGIAGGAEEVAIAENKVTAESIIQQIITNRGIGKRHSLVIIAEGAGHSDNLARKIQAVTGIETRSTVLGHLQRGGAPTALDRMRAGVMGYNAVELFLAGEKNLVMTYGKGEYSHMDLFDSLTAVKPYDNKLYEIIKVLAI
jgi:6-phosphofructokinase 1